MILEKILNPPLPVRCIITGPANNGKSVILTNLIFNFISKYDKVYIYSPSPHQDLYQKLITCFIKYIPINITTNTLNEENTGIAIEENLNMRELKFPQEYEDELLLSQMI